MRILIHLTCYVMVAAATIIAAYHHNPMFVTGIAYQALVLWKAYIELNETESTIKDLEDRIESMRSTIDKLHVQVKSMNDRK